MPTTFSTATPFLPDSRTLPNLRRAAAICRGCDLYERAQQTVFGEGPARCDWLLVGEQPGDYEDRDGRPFVGPAGRMLDRALVEIGMARDQVYLTNAVKHFKWEPKGKRRIHVEPAMSEVRACLPWLEAEIEAVEPGLIVCLGAVAVRALLGSAAKVMTDRGRVIESPYGPCLVTVHPSSLLRVEDSAERRAAYEAFLYDLRQGLTFRTRRLRAV
jgi:DNA polymerase